MMALLWGHFLNQKEKAQMPCGVAGLGQTLSRDERPAGILRLPRCEDRRVKAEATMADVLLDSHQETAPSSNRHGGQCPFALYVLVMSCI